MGTLTAGTGVTPLGGFVAKVSCLRLTHCGTTERTYLFAPHASERTGICFNPTDRIPTGCWGWESKEAARKAFERYRKTKCGQWSYLGELKVDARGNVSNGGTDDTRQ